MNLTTPRASVRQTSVGDAVEIIRKAFRCGETDRGARYVPRNEFEGGPEAFER